MHEFCRRIGLLESVHLEQHPPSMQVYIPL